MNRRKFIKSAALLALAPTVPMVSVPATMTDTAIIKTDKYEVIWKGPDSSGCFTSPDADHAREFFDDLLAFECQCQMHHVRTRFAKLDSVVMKKNGTTVYFWY